MCMKKFDKSWQASSPILEVGFVRLPQTGPAWNLRIAISVDCLVTGCQYLSISYLKLSKCVANWVLLWSDCASVVMTKDLTRGCYLVVSRHTHGFSVHLGSHFRAHQNCQATRDSLVVGWWACRSLSMRGNMWGFPLPLLSENHRLKICQKCSYPHLERLSALNSVLVGRLTALMIQPSTGLGWFRYQDTKKPRHQTHQFLDF